MSLCRQKAHTGYSCTNTNYGKLATCSLHTFISSHGVFSILFDPTGEQFLPYTEVKDQETTEKDRPSLKKKTEKRGSLKTASATPTCSQQNDQTAANDASISGSGDCVDEGSTAQFLSAQTARATAECVECRKPRVIYSSKKLSQRQEVLLASSFSEFEYSCGSHLFPPSCSTLVKELALRPNITCSTPIHTFLLGVFGSRGRSH